MWKGVFSGLIQLHICSTHEDFKYLSSFCVKKAVFHCFVRITLVTILIGLNLLIWGVWCVSSVGGCWLDAKMLDCGVGQPTLLLRFFQTYWYCKSIKKVHCTLSLKAGLTYDLALIQFNPIAISTHYQQFYSYCYCHSSLLFKYQTASDFFILLTHSYTSMC